jgi:hypothetical protein
MVTEALAEIGNKDELQVAKEMLGRAKAIARNETNETSPPLGNLGPDREVGRPA